MAASSQDSGPGTGQAYTGVVAGLAVATLSTIFLPVREDDVMMITMITFNLGLWSPPQPCRVSLRCCHPESDAAKVRSRDISKDKENKKARETGLSSKLKLIRVKY